MPPTPLPRSFFLHPPDVVAQALLGKRIVRHLEAPHEPLTARIVETEAYFASDDPAAHAFTGRTPRNEVLFGPPGHAYVYFIYGMHHCLNVSCEPEGRPGCVLIRALEPISGLAHMAQLRGSPATAPRQLASGPGRLCQALAITRQACNGADVCSPQSPLIFADDNFPPPRIATGPRIGIRKAVGLPARFWIEANPFVSRT